MPLVDLTDAYDLHIHSNPSLFTRMGDDLDVARHAADAGLAGILLKNHFESTVGRAYLAGRVVETVQVFGGLVLNHSCGGLNPVAVEQALRLGAKQIWMPTLDAQGHVDVYGAPGGFGYQDSGTKIRPAGITILDNEGRLKDEVRVIVELVRDFEAVLGTAHLSQTEIFRLAEFAREVKLKKLLITHPYFDPPNLSIPGQADLVGLGVTLELCGGNLYPIPGLGRIDNYRQTVAEVGPGSIILTSDAGQPRKSLPAEVLRIFAQCLMEKGVSQDEIDVMTKENPARLLGL